jgi:hypothetical protein
MRIKNEKERFKEVEESYSSRWNLGLSLQPSRKTEKKVLTRQ